MTSPTFSLTHLHHYVNELTITDDLGSVSGVVEWDTDGEFLVWENEFQCESGRRKILMDALAAHLVSKECRYTIFWGRDR
jgi:hypothetical protein